MNKHKHQLGFGAVEIILIIVIVGILGFVGWKVYEAQQQPSTPQAADTPQPAKPAEEKHITYSNDEFDYQFQYPVDWKTSDYQNEVNASPTHTYKYSLTIDSPDLASSEEGIGYHLTKGARLFVSVEPTTHATPDAYFNRNGFLPSVARDKKEVAIDGNPALSYSLSWESTNELTTFTIKNGYAYSISMSYADEADRDKYRAEYELLVNSFKLSAE